MTDSARLPRDARLPPLWIRLSAELYRECADAAGAPDGVLARAFRGNPRLDDAGRGFVADTVQGMLRARGFLEAALRRLGADADAARLFLYVRRGLSAGRRNDAFDRAAAAARRETGGVDLLVPEWLKRTPPFGRELLHALAQEPPVTLRVNTLRAARDWVQRRLEAEGIATRPTRHSPWGLTLLRRAGVFRTAAFREGQFEMQDEGSQLVAALCAAAPGDVVVDGCAGAGGKTLALAAAMKNRGTLYAFDTAAFRLDALRQRARRAGAQNLRVHLRAPGDPGFPARLAGRAAVVLVDAPCTGTGVLRRNPDIGWKLREEDVPRLAAAQAELLRTHAPLVKPGGRLVYAVCSLLPAEGPSQIERFLAAHPEFRRADAAALLRASGAAPDGLLREGDLALDPLHHGTDGFYAAALERAPAGG